VDVQLLDRKLSAPIPAHHEVIVIVNDYDSGAFPVEDKWEVDDGVNHIDSSSGSIVEECVARADVDDRGCSPAGF
jgi:hypothetical protein